MSIHSTFVVIGRRVHITSVTLEHLNSAYKVEDGDGQERDPYLKEHGVVTYLVVNPKVLCPYDSCTQIIHQMLGSN